MNTAVPATLGDRVGLVEHLVDRALATVDPLGDQLAAAPPRGHLDQQADARSAAGTSRRRGSSATLADEEREVDDQQRDDDEQRLRTSTSSTCRGRRR